MWIIITLVTFLVLLGVVGWIIWEVRHAENETHNIGSHYDSNDGVTEFDLVREEFNEAIHELHKKRGNP